MLSIVERAPELPLSFAFEGFLLKVSPKKGSNRKGSNYNFTLMFAFAAQMATEHKAAGPAS